MSVARTYEIFRQEFAHNLRRPLFWVQIAILAFMTFMLSVGKASMGSGDATVGGHKAWITSEFAVAQTLIILISLIYVFFVSVAAGMSVIRDDEQRVGELLHSTPLRPAEYVWGKYLAVLVSFIGVLAIHVGLAMICNHLLPHGGNAEFIGPFRAANYLRPVFVFALPVLVLFTGACFAIGGWSRMPVLVFAFPIGVLLVDAFFLWDWSPSWLPLGLNRVLQFADPTGLRWLKENWLLVDHGVDFYNHAGIGLDALVVAQRFTVLALGLGCVALFERRLARTLRGSRNVPAAKRGRAAVHAPAADGSPARRSPVAPLTTLGMRSSTPGVIAGTLEVVRTELAQLVRAPGLYLFVPLILLQTLLSEYALGAFDTPLLQTSGTLATSMLNTLTLLVSMVILFYTTESLQRERSTGFGSIYYATPLRTGAMLAGKAIANTVLGISIVLACLLGCFVLLAVQGRVPIELAPFALVWGLLLVPTYLVWTSFTSAVYAATSSRYATYATGLAVMCLSGWFQLRGHMNWMFNWDLWSATRWTDLATFEYDRVPLLLNRLTVLGLAVFFAVLTVRLFERRERDATRVLVALRPRALAGSFASFAPFLVVPLITGTVLGLAVNQGYEGAAAKKARLDYWRKNIETWKDAPTPSLAGVDLDVRFDPPRHAFTMRGSYVLQNLTNAPLARFPLSVNPRWHALRWTADGDTARVESRAGLVIVTAPKPLPPGGTMKLGFSFDGRQPDGISKNGSYAMEFIMPSSIVLTGFGGVTFVPIPGFYPDQGVETDKNDSDPREWPADWWQHEARAAIPTADRWYDVHMRVDVPSDLRVNATGEEVSETTRGGRTISEWRTDAPVRTFNLVAGRWVVKRRPGVAVYYDPKHPYNVDEMLDALVGARRWYGEWFAPYPWKTLRLSEFAGWPTYAQAPAGNITFSENIGFLTRSKPEADAAFWIAAHESAHQWWPNMAMTADGPGTEILSEGMAHFSTLLLTEKMRGEAQRRAFALEMEDRYGKSRRADSERPLVQLDGRMPGDSRIWYDKGGWALWMLHRFQGPDRGLAAIREYMQTYRDSRRHASLQDYLLVQRRHAADSTAFDAFTRQWFFTVVAPHYLIDDARLVRDGDAWRVNATVRNVGTGAMPIDVAAAVGDRDPVPGKPSTPWRDARVNITLAAGEKREVEIRCPFEPTKLVVDPDVTVLMLERKKAEVKLAPSATATVAAVAN